MLNYRIHFYPEHRTEVLRFLQKSPQVNIDTMDVNSVYVRIDVHNADLFYQKLMAEMDIAMNSPSKI